MQANQYDIGRESQATFQFGTAWLFLASTDDVEALEAQVHDIDNVAVVMATDEDIIPTETLLQV